jgi:ribokinase
MRRAGPIVVIGSINMDLVCQTPAIPRAGETILGGDLQTIPGGKGANQAVAAARLGGDVHMIGRVGDDAFGRTLLAGLRENGVNVKHVSSTPGVASGCAMIAVDERGENSIVVSPGANARVSIPDIDLAAPLIRRASVVVLQLEIPIVTVRYVITLCREAGVPTILDPAPVPPGGLPTALFRVNILTPNEHELRELLRAPNSAGTVRKPKALIIKMGERGSLWMKGPTTHQSRAFPVTAIDTTAAGDAFTGALAVAVAEGVEIADAMRFANAAGALCCTKRGAQPSLPTRTAVDRLIRGTTKPLRRR